MPAGSGTDSAVPAVPPPISTVELMTLHHAIAETIQAHGLQHLHVGVDAQEDRVVVNASVRVPGDPYARHLRVLLGREELRDPGRVAREIVAALPAPLTVSLCWSYRDGTWRYR